MLVEFRCWGRLARGLLLPPYEALLTSAPKTLAEVTVSKFNSGKNYVPGGELRFIV